MSLPRLQTDFRFALLTLFGALTVLCVLPIAVYRLALGTVIAGLVDLAIVACVGGSVLYLWRGGSIERTAAIGVVTYSLGCVAIAQLAGLAGVLWMYPVLVANFLLVRPRHAFVASALAVAAVALIGSGFPDMFARVLFVVTAVVVSLFAYIFARRTELQRAQLELLVTRDPLTAAYNRRAMEQELPIALETSRRSGLPAALAVIDLDHFKRINDSGGHETGDRVLVEFARVVTAATRRGDRLFRYGGEEFVLLLPGMDAAAAASFAETLRARVAGELGAGGEPVTVSIGVAVLAPGDASNAWLARADAAMYRAKREGRNRVVLAAPPAQATVVELPRRPRATSAD